MISPTRRLAAIVPHCDQETRDGDALRCNRTGAELYAADVYCGLPTGGAVDAVADAFSWLAREQVPVINVSLVGAPNLMLENVRRAQRREIGEEQRRREVDHPVEPVKRTGDSRTSRLSFTPADMAAMQVGASGSLRRGSLSLSLCDGEGSRG
jgi:hypothetical protein